MNSIQDFGEATMTSLATAMALFFAAIPRLIGFVLIVLIGWFVATLLEKLVAKILRVVKFNELAKRSGFSDFVHRMGVDTDAAGFLALLSKWFVRLIVLVVAFDALGLPAVSEVLRQMLLWLPNLVVALVVLVIAGLLANAASKVVRGATSEAGFDNPDLLAKLASVAIWVFGIVVAVNQIGIATTLVNTLFMAVVGGLALALGLAFGLGGRETAAKIVASWYEAGKSAGKKAEIALKAAQDDVQQLTKR